ncbi:SPOR domain-containing protein [Paenochrobactrum sp. BZR 588]|uniref:SPOR domain-containing protein n=1 Tax=unclassified Paenochrobactrum TaxID=2639760 RepID=UPI00385467F7
MTDSSYKARENGERPVQEEDDPLMQLSQIGGFDELFSAQSTHQDTTPSDDMFAIDLERELVGGLDDDFFGQDVPDVFSEMTAPQTAAPEVAATAADNYRDSYRSASARSYASYNQGSHGYGSLTQHLQSPPASADVAEEENLPVTEEDHQPTFAAQETPASQEPYSYADQAYNSALEDELALALSGHEDVLSGHYQSNQSGYQDSYQTEPQVEAQETHDYTPPAAAVPAPSLEDELANLLFGDAAPAAYEEPASVYIPEEPLYSELQNEPKDEVFSSFDQAAEELEPHGNIDDFAAQFSIESGNYQPASTQASYDEPSFAETATLSEDTYYAEDASYQEQASSAEPVHHSSDEPPQDMFFDDTSFAVETSDIELNALNQASAEFEATLADLPQDDAFELDDENFSEAIERELSAQSYFPWEKDKPLHDGQEFVASPSDAPSENFFSDQDFDFGIEETELQDATDKVVEKTPVFAHAISEEERQPAPFPHYAAQRSSFSVPAPDVETMSVSEAKVEQTQPLDLPEVPYYDEPENAGLNQLEAEFADVFSAINVEETPAPVEEAASADRAFEDIFRESYADFSPSNTALAGGLAAGAAIGAGLGARNQAPASQAPTGSQDDFYNHWADGSNGAGAQQAPVAPYSLDEDLGAAADAYRERPVRGRRAMLLATAAGVLVLIGGIAYHFIGGGMNSGEPVIIRSDNQPVKMQPENPGGATVPNQDKAVYERVAGTIPQNPEQKSLVTAQEDPVDLAADEDEFGSFNEDRNDTITATNNSPATEEEPLIVPRTVQTMVVRPDGTIVQQPAEAPRSVTPVAPEPAELTPENIIESSALTPAETANTQTNVPASAPVAPARTVETQNFTPPTQVPVAPSRPAQQPTNVVATTPATPAVSETPAAPAAGGYYIQIASQPSAELAQKSFASMGQKYANIIGGRAVDIRKADIPGKGTYYRVRISGGTKAEANALCERLKNAGGSCFVTQ